MKKSPRKQQGKINHIFSIDWHRHERLKYRVLTGVYEYLRTERMLEARQLLSDRHRNVKEVAALTGYQSVNSFIKAFKKKYGETPGEFRKRA